MNRVRITLLLSAVLIIAAYFLLKSPSEESKQDLAIGKKAAPHKIEPGKKFELAQIQPATFSVKVDQLVGAQ